MAPKTPPQDQANEPRSNGSDESRSSHERPAPLPSSSSVGDHLAQALRDLARGEQTANTLEANLTSLENKLDAILASLGVSAADLDALDREDEQHQQQQKKNGSSGEGKGAGEGVEGKKGSA